MRVPTRSAGTRSGVNWMRRKLPRTVAASVFTVSVFASPGTPSTSRCPCASVATSTRSRKWSWPTTVFFTSYRMRSISGATSIASRGSIGSLERIQAYRARGILDRHREGDADEYALLGRVEQAGHDADDLAVGGDERPARVAGIRRGVELDQVGEDALARSRAVLALQARDHAVRGRRADAEREADGEHRVARA